jgi:hypothetical protein
MVRGRDMLARHTTRVLGLIEARPQPRKAFIAGTGLTAKQVNAGTFLTDYVETRRRTSPYVSILCGAVGLEF